MGISQICQTIKNYFNNERKPFPQLPRTLLICSLIKRPGLSTVASVSNIVKDLNRMGIPTGVMPDGSVNLTVAFTYSTVKEIYRALRKDASIQGGTVPGTMGNMTPGENISAMF